jgi:predicted small lipoprotein YifL
MSVIVSIMKIIRSMLVVLALSSIALATSACPEKGPVEKAGEKIDDAIDETKEAVKEPTK